MRSGTAAGWMVVGLAFAWRALAQQPGSGTKVLAAPSAAVARYLDPNLDLVMMYPAALLPHVPETLRTVWERDHLKALGSAELDPAAYRVALKCLNTVFEARGERKPMRTVDGEYAPDTLLVLDLDRSCVDGEFKGERALGVMAEVALRTHFLTPVVAPVVMHEGKRHVHTGLSSGRMIVNDVVAGAAGAEVGRQAPVYVAAASFEQQQHLILVVYLNGTSGEQDALLGKTSVSFHGETPVVLFPFLAGVVKAK